MIPYGQHIPNYTNISYLNKHTRRCEFPSTFITILYSQHSAVTRVRIERYIEPTICFPYIKISQITMKYICKLLISHITISQKSIISIQAKSL